MPRSISSPIMAAGPVHLPDHLPISIATLSLGRAVVHDLESKLAAAAEAGYKGVEAFYEDIKLPARELCKSNPGSSFTDNLLLSAKHMRELCDKYGLAINCLQPFKNYDGIRSPQRRKEKLEKLHLWFKMCHILETDLIDVPSMFHDDPEISTSNEEIMVKDLQELADLGAKESPPIRFTYENMAWGAYVTTWQEAWRIVKKVDRPNMGICLDTFQILSTVYGNPCVASGMQENAEQAVEKDIRDFMASVEPEKVFFIQLCDAERLVPELSPEHPWYNPKQKPVLTWSRNARLFPMEEERGGYLPVTRLLKTWLVDFGYAGWISFEVYSRTLFNPDKSVPAEHARRGIESWRKCVEYLGLVNGRFTQIPGRTPLSEEHKGWQLECKL